MTAFHSFYESRIPLCMYYVSIFYMPCLVAQSCLTLCDPVDCSLPCSSVHGDSPGKSTGVGNPGIEPGSPALQVDSLPAELPEKPHMCMCVYIYRYTCIIFFIHSSVTVHLHCFLVLAIVNSATVNFGVHIYFWMIVFVFSRHMPRSWIAGSSNNTF